jgi:hypothetical protein
LSNLIPNPNPHATLDLTDRDLALALGLADLALAIALADLANTTLSHNLADLNLKIATSPSPSTSVTQPVTSPSNSQPRPCQHRPQGDDPGLDLALALNLDDLAHDIALDLTDLMALASLTLASRRWPRSRPRPQGGDHDLNDLALDLDLSNLALNLNLSLDLNDLSLNLKTVTTMAPMRKDASHPQQEVASGRKATSHPRQELAGNLQS